MKKAIPALGSLTPEWADFIIMAGAFALVAIGALIWVLFLRKKGRRRRKHRHQRGDHSSNPPPAPAGEQPPARPANEPSGRQTPTSQP